MEKNSRRSANECIPRTIDFILITPAKFIMPANLQTKTIDYLCVCVKYCQKLFHWSHNIIFTFRAWQSRTQRAVNPGASRRWLLRGFGTSSICLIGSLVLSISWSERRQMKSLGTSLLQPLKDFLSKWAYNGRKVFNNIFFFNLAGFPALLWKEFEGVLFVEGKKKRKK